jgi:translation initiation factor 3 subunit G
VGAGKVSCRLCKGDHFTAKCPFKDKLGALETAGEEDTGAEPAAPAAAGGASTTGKYVPPSMRAGAGRGGERMGGPGGGSRDDLPTLRVTNVSEDTQENDLRDLFGAFGRVARVYVGRDRETGAGKGFAFVSFEDRAVAQRAMEKVNGRGYDNLILSVQWSRKCFLRCYDFLLTIHFQSRVRMAVKSAQGAVTVKIRHTINPDTSQRAVLGSSLMGNWVLEVLLPK